MPRPPEQFPEHPEEGPPPRAPLPDAGSVRRMGMRLFLMSLGLFFAASLLVFILTDLSRPSEYPPVSKPTAGGDVAVDRHPSARGGGCRGGSAWNARRGRVDGVRRWVKVTFFTSIAFVAVQSHAIVRLFHEHELSLTTPGLGMEGVTFCLIAIHAAHVLGGLVPLGSLAWRAAYGRLGLEHLPTVRGCATYWHFLEGVMFATFDQERWLGPFFRCRRHAYVEILDLRGRKS